MDAFDRAVRHVGDQVKLAAKIGVTPQALSGWRAKGTIPHERVLEISRACDWTSTPHQLRPDLYPHPDDGLPDELRGIHAHQEAA